MGERFNLERGGADRLPAVPPSDPLSFEDVSEHETPFLLARGDAGAGVERAAYVVGDWIEHDALGERRESIVLERCTDIRRDGGPDGFLGFTVRPRRMVTWGYDPSVLRVLRHADMAELAEYRDRCDRWLDDAAAARCPRI